MSDDPTRCHFDLDNVSRFSDRPLFPELSEQLKSLNRWQQFGTFLPGITETIILRIEKERSKDIELQKFALFAEWLRIHPNASWKAVIIALEKANEQTLALKIFQNLEFEVYSTTSHKPDISISPTQEYGIGKELELQIVREGEAKQKLRSLIVSFLDLLEEIKKELDSKVHGETVAITNITRHIQPLVDDDLSEVVTVDQLFKKMEPYYDFLDCEIVVILCEKYNTSDVVQKIKDHNKVAMEFRNSEPIKTLRKGLREFYLPLITESNKKAPKAFIKLNEAWNDVVIRGLEKLLEHLLPKDERKSLLKHIKIIPGSVIIEYILLQSLSNDIKGNARAHIQFFSLVGVYELVIDDENFLSGMEDRNFNFDSALFNAAGNGHVEAVRFILALGAYLNYCNENGATPLMYAINNGHCEVAKLLLKRKADPNIKAHDGTTALIIACHNDLYEVVQWLLKEQADPNVQWLNGETPLIIASKKGYYKIVELLLNQKADPNILTHNGATAVFLASASGYDEIVELLLRERADPNIQWHNGETALYVASKNGHYQTVWLLLKHRANPNIVSHTGSTALFAASIQGHHEVVELLLNGNADPNIEVFGSGTALFIASQNGHHKVVELLLDAHVDPNDQTDSGATALFIASENGFYKVVKLLLQRRAYPNIQWRNGATPLLVASQNGHYQVVELLLKEQADPNIKTNNGTSALFIASENGHYHVVELLLRYHANNIQEQDGGKALLIASQKGYHNIVELLLNCLIDPNFKGKDNVTALLSASFSGKYEIVKILLKEKADVNAQTVQGWTALMLAIANGHHDVVELLIIKGADVNICAFDGSTALSLAKDLGHSQIIQLLQKYSKQDLKEHSAMSREHLKHQHTAMEKSILIEEQSPTKSKRNDEIDAYLGIDNRKQS